MFHYITYNHVKSNVRYTPRILIRKWFLFIFIKIINICQGWGVPLAWNSKHRSHMDLLSNSNINKIIKCSIIMSAAGTPSFVILNETNIKINRSTLIMQHV